MYEDVLSSLGLSEGAKLEKIFSPAGGGRERCGCRSQPAESLLSPCVKPQNTEPCGHLLKRLEMEFGTVRVVGTWKGNGRKSHLDPCRPSGKLILCI